MRERFSGPFDKQVPKEHTCLAVVGALVLCGVSYFLVFLGPPGSFYVASKFYLHRMRRGFGF